jgi:hypothetical protein
MRASRYGRNGEACRQNDSSEVVHRSPPCCFYWIVCHQHIATTIIPAARSTNNFAWKLVRVPDARRHHQRVYVRLRHAMVTRRRAGTRQTARGTGSTVQREERRTASGTRGHPCSRQKKKAPRNEPQRLRRPCAGDQLVCWIAESSQSAPRRRAKVHTSVASIGVSLPATRRPVVRSMVLSTSENRIATLA